MRALVGSAFHSQILRQVSDAVIAIDQAGLVTYVNPAAERLYRTTAEMAVGRPLLSLYDYRWLDGTDEADAAAALARDGYWHGKNLHLLPDGTALHVDSAVSLLKDDTGSATGLLAIIRDVTEARRAEDAAREREERIHRVLAIDTVGVLFFRLDGRMTDANAAFERMSGYSLDELRSRDWRVLTPPEFLDVTKDAAHNLRTLGETSPYQKQMVRKDGSRWWGLFAPKRLSGSGVDTECVEFILDVTDAKRAEAALQESEQRQRMALDAAQLGTWKHDVAAGIVQLDPRACAHYDVDGPAVPIAEIQARIHAEDAPAVRDAMFGSLDPALRRPVAAEYRVRHRHGGIRWLSVNGQVRFDDDSEGEARPTVGIGTTRDITQQKQVEEALREADQRKDEFLAILAHELRNPLAPIRTAVGVMRAPNVPETMLLRARAIVERQVAHMARLVDDLLDVSRLSRGQLSLQRARVALDQVLDLAIETARPLVQERGHRLDERRVPGRVVVYADVARLSQVFANLLNNAAKYTPPGGAITLDVVDGDGHVEVNVTDTGQGIAAEYLEKVFELFAQGSGAGARSVGGLGIGLALARQLVELHGGSLAASSSGPGQGTTMTVSLPTLPSGTTGHAVPQLTRLTVEVSRRVLVVDDNRDAADTLAMLLRASGCEVRTAYGGAEALAEVPGFRPDVVLLDLGMPGVDGFEACRQIRSLPEGTQMRIVAVTGWGQEESRRRTQRAGFDAHVVKPIAPEALLDVVQNTAGRIGG